MTAHALTHTKTHTYAGFETSGYAVYLGSSCMCDTDKFVFTMETLKKSRYDQDSKHTTFAMNWLSSLMR